MDAEQSENATLSYPSEVPNVITEDTNMESNTTTSIEEQQRTDMNETMKTEETPAPDAAVDNEETTDVKEKTIDEEVTTEQPVEQEQVEEPQNATKESSSSPVATTTTTTADQENTVTMETDQDISIATPNMENQDIKEDVEEYTPMEGISHQTDDAPPFLSAPASWQIPVAALHQQQQQQQQQQKSVEQPVVNSKINLRKERYESRIKENKYDIEAWTWLINDAQQTGDLEVIREIYERFLNVFPTSPKHWLAYLELELKYSNFNEVEALFTRCLKTVLSVDLWKFYLGYIRRINSGESGSSVTPEARAIIEKAYEYVLSNVSFDKDAGPIWADYIYFLKSAETSNTWEEQRKMDSMRRAYQKAVTIPLNNVEHLWKEYDQWENNLNRLTAKKFLGEKSSAYMTARTALREMRLFTDNINNNGVSLPPKWTANELAQLDLWKNYIQWEKSDPLQLEDETAVMDRVAYTYQQAFLVLRLYPEIWYSFASYYLELNKPEKSLSILKQGIEIMPTSLLLNFSYAELCESKRQLDEARQAYDQLVTTLDKNIEDLKQAAQQEINKLHEEADVERASLNLSDDIDGEVREQLRSREKHVKKEQDAIEKKLNDQVEVIARGGSLVWINYMRFARRTDGIKSARALFSRARKATNCTYHVYVSDALMEYHNSKDATIAGKVFSLGQKSFADNPDFVCEYLDFLIEMNDDNNTRALFERTLATMPAEKAGPIWLKFLDYENKYGDLASIQNVEKRRIEAMATPSINTMESFLKRQSYLDVRNIEDQELGWVARDQQLADAAAAITGTSSGNESTTNLQQQQQQIQQQQMQQQQQQQQHQHQHQQHSKDHQKRPLLEPVHPERYPRPDLNQWQSYKPAVRPANASPIITSVVPTAPAPEQQITPQIPVKIEPITQSVIPPQQQQQPSWNSPSMPVPIISNTASAAVIAPSIPPSSLPDAVAYFVSNLPPAQTFNGPMIQPGELVDLLRSIIIPLPPQSGNVASQQPPPQQQQQQQSQRPNKPPMHQQQQNRDSGRGGNNYGNQRGGRGGYNKRGGGNMPMRGGGSGGKPNMKRRGRDDYDDDYQPHKGMGPNRPPDFDLFRQRQAKRHRDDPPY